MKDWTREDNISEFEQSKGRREKRTCIDKILEYVFFSSSDLKGPGTALIKYQKRHREDSDSINAIENLSSTDIQPPKGSTFNK